MLPNISDKMEIFHHKTRMGINHFSDRNKKKSIESDFYSEKLLCNSEYILKTREKSNKLITNVKQILYILHKRNVKKTVHFVVVLNFPF